MKVKKSAVNISPIKKTPVKKKIIIILSAIISLMLIIVIISYVSIHSIIHKMNLVTSSNASEFYDNNSGSNLPSEGDNLLPEEKEDIAELPEASSEAIAALEDKILKNMEKNQTPIDYDDDIFNILLIGGDSRKSGGTGRSDAMMLISINRKQKKIIVTSILRDIYLQIPGKKYNRINAAYAYGGADLLLETVRQNFKIQVNKYASIDFYSFIDIVNAVGGVTLDVHAEDLPVINGYIAELNQLTDQTEGTDYLSKAGTLLLDGKQALGFARNRYTGNNDFERTSRQRQVLAQLFEKMKKLNLIELKDLLNIILPQVTTNLTEGEIFSMILSLPVCVNYDVEQWSIPEAGSYTPMNVRGMAVLGIDFDENIGELNDKIYGK